MEAVLTRCGYRCDLCLAYRPNVERDPGNQQKLSDGWFQYFGFRIEPARIICDGCMEDDPQLIDRTCPVRPCAMDRKLDNCSQCSQYICEKLQERIVTYEDVQHRVAADIPGDDYSAFIQPYENKRRLNAYKMTGEIIK